MVTFEMGQIYLVKEETAYYTYRIPEGILLLVVGLYSSNVEFRIIDTGEKKDSTVMPSERLSWTVSRALKKSLELTRLREDDIVQPQTIQSKHLFKLEGLQNPGVNLISPR